MKLEDIKKYLEDNKDNEDVKAFVQGLNPITKDRVDTFVRTDKEGMSWLDSEKDKHHKKALETWKTNNLHKLVDEKVKELYPEDDPKDVELKKLQKEMENMKKDKLREQLTNKALLVADEKKLPKDIISFFLGSDEESTVKNLESLENVFSTHVTKLVDEKLKGGYKPPGTKSPDSPNVEFAKKMAEKRNEATQTGENPYFK